ncbi:MAG: kinase, partial [Candidatus Methanomethylophilaceae archaeon]|nr:kinase [Candidatus Methanomethylophilaceae archaeon]
NMMSVHSTEYGDLVADLKNGPLPLNGNMDLVKVVANHFSIKNGFRMDIESEAPPGSGLGGSSAVIVSIVSAVCRWIGRTMGKEETAKLAYDLERKELGLTGGRQDQYASVFGGFNLMRFRGDDVTVDNVPVSEEIMSELQSRSVLCYTGSTRESADVIDSQIKSFRKGDNEKALDASKDLAVGMAETLRRGDITETGSILHQSWQLKKQFSEKITNPMIDRMYESAKSAGAIGGKVSGAGGGGFMFFICKYNRKYDVAKALQKTNPGAKVVDFMFQREGVKSWGYDDERHII